jgi:hypothetical protein
MSLAKNYAIVKNYTRVMWQVSRIETLIQILERDYNFFVTPQCLQVLSRGAHHQLIPYIENLDDVKNMLQDMAKDDGTLPIVLIDIQARIISLLSRFLRQCQRQVNVIIQIQHAFRHRYYQPGGHGYRRAQNNFRQLSQA